ncbi:MAG: hypothetical protein U0795_02460 [Pirellulales bacterium]
MFRTANCVLLLCVMGFGSTSGQAAFTESSDPRYPGTANTTIDTATGLEWLDWSVTANQSYDLVKSQLAPGGRYEGWRLASDDNMAKLLVDLKLPYGPLERDAYALGTVLSGMGPLSPLTQFDKPYMTVWQTVVMGNVHNMDVYNFGACYADSLQLWVYGHHDYPEAIVFAYGSKRARFAGERDCGDTIGWALVREVHSVPEPSGLVMLCLAIPRLMRRIRQRVTR